MGRLKLLLRWLFTMEEWMYARCDRTESRRYTRHVTRKNLGDVGFLL